VEIREAAERAAALTRQLLAFSRKQVLQPRNVDLNTIISGVEKMLRRLIGEVIVLDVALGKGLAPVVADPGQLEQVIMNLVINARDAMPSGGRITLETSSSPDQKWSVLTVRDTGCGMDEQTVRRIFEPFFTTKGSGRGTGLGLSTCYGIVAQSDGAISVESKLNEGSAFAVRLPIAPPSDDDDDKPRSSVPHSSRGDERVLLVEDDDRARALTSRILEGLGYHLRVARHPNEAVELLQQHGPVDLLLTDVVMPGCSGPECAEKVVALCPGARVLFMSGYTDHPAFAHRGLATTFNFIQKPFAPEALARKVREVLDGRKATR
jgi:two-component system cell cycle sensor histidine kinase/response regulator CckA